MWYVNISYQTIKKKIGEINIFCLWLSQYPEQLKNIIPLFQHPVSINIFPHQNLFLNPSRPPLQRCPRYSVEIYNSAIWNYILRAMISLILVPVEISCEVWHCPGPAPFITPAFLFQPLNIPLKYLLILCVIKLHIFISVNKVSSYTIVWLTYVYTYVQYNAWAVGGKMVTSPWDL